MLRSDFERRVLANLSIPRSVPTLAEILTKDDGTLGAGVRVEAIDVGEALADLEARGLVVNLGEHADAAGVLRAARGRGNLKMPKVKAENYRELATHRYQWWLAGEQWYMTARGLEALQAPVTA